ncbi:MAG: DUF1330 domain-containing protein [Bradyrhizobium sp.]
MPAYMIVRADITHEERFGRYRQAVVPLIESFGGRHIRSGAVERLEGDQDGSRIALFEFPTVEAIHAFWDSPAYVPVKEMRRGAATLDVWAVPGV